MEITREQFANMLNKAPQGIQPAELAEAAWRKGYTLQGMETPPQFQTAQTAQLGGRPQLDPGARQVAGDQPGFFKRLISPAINFGKSIGGALEGSESLLAKGIRGTQSLIMGDGFDTRSGTAKVDEAAQVTIEQQSEILRLIREAKEKGEDTTKLLEILKMNQDALDKIPGAEELNPALNKTTRQVIGEAMGTFGLLTLGGSLGGGAISTTQGLRTTGTLAGASFAGGQALENDADTATAIKESIKGGLWGLAGAELGIQVVNRIPKLLSIFTGESDAVVRAAMSNPAAADAALKGGDVALREAVQQAGQTSVKLKDSFIKGHTQTFNEIMGSVIDKKVQKSGLIAQFKANLTKNGVKIKNGTLDFTTSKLQANPGEVSRIKQAWQAINQWDDWTVGGVNKYKQLVGELTGFFDEGGKAAKSQFLSNMYGNVAEVVKKEVPKGKLAAYEAMNQKFSQNIGLYDDMVTAFNSGDPFQRMAGLFGKNKDALRQTVDFFESQAGKTISPVVGGREIGLHKQAAFGFLNPRSWIDFFIEPSMQGKVVTGSGRIGEGASKLRDVLTQSVR